jgi:hypothetical protein
VWREVFAHTTRGVELLLSDANHFTAPLRRRWDRLRGSSRSTTEAACTNKSVAVANTARDDETAHPR